MTRRATVISLLVCAIAAFAGAPAQARAKSTQAPAADVNVPLYQAGDPNATPPGFSVTPGRAAVIARTSRRLLAIHRTHHPLQYRVFFWAGSHYEVFFTYRGKLIADVIVGPRGQLGATYTGPLMLGIYARGHYGQLFDSPWVLGPFSLLFALPLILLRRRSWLDVADIASVMSFGASYAFFDTGHAVLGVWLAYPPLLYLLVRMLRRGFCRHSSRAAVEVRLPTAVLIGGLLLLMAGRIAVTLLPAHPLDVGQASVIGAYRILHGQPIYFPSQGHPDTYGPIMYLAYVPFQLLWPGDQWAYVPSARAATITFDLLTIAALFVLGTRLRAGRDGRRLGLLMAWLWAACPATVLGLVKSTNDGLIALLVVVAILTLSAPVRRGITIGLAVGAKFIPAVLLPLLAAGRGPEDRPAVRKLLAAFVIVCGASVAGFLPPGGLKEMWEHTLGFQLTRQDIFSPWALHPGLAPVKDAIELGVAGLALLVAFRPRGARTTAQVSALAAALLIAVQLPAIHWFYFYIVWFFPLVLIAVLGVGAGADAAVQPLAVPELEAELTEPPGELVGAA